MEKKEFIFLLLARNFFHLILMKTELYLSFLNILNEQILYEYLVFVPKQQ